MDNAETDFGQIETGSALGRDQISICAAPKAGASAVVGDQEEKEDGGDGNGEAGPVKRPASYAGLCAGVEPKSRAQVASKITEAAGHEGEKGLGASAPDGFDAFVEIDLRRDEDEGE